MLVVRKRMSVGPYVLEQGDIVSDDMKKELPPGRLATLREQGWVEEKPEDVPLLRLVKDLEARVARLEALSDREPARRGRPPKTIEE